MKPLGFSLEQMSAMMRDLETARDRAAIDRHPDARERLAGILADPSERRQQFARQVAMADEFIDQLGQQLS